MGLAERGARPHGENRLGAAGDIELGVDVLQVPLGGGQGDSGTGTDLGIGQAPEQAVEDLRLLVGELAEQIRQRGAALNRSGEGSKLSGDILGVHGAPTVMQEG